MSRVFVFLAAVAVVLATVHVATSNQPAVPGEGVSPLSVLVGRTVGLQPVGERYNVVVDPRMRFNMLYTVLAVDGGILVLEDQSRTDTLYVPFWSIREVSLSKTGVRR